MPPAQQQIHPAQQQMPPAHQQQMPPAHQQQMPPVQQKQTNSTQNSTTDNELEPYSICEMGGCSDNYSYIEDNKIIQHSYELINDNNKELVKDNSISQNSNNGSVRQKKIPDGELQKFMNERNSIITQPMERI